MAEQLFNGFDDENDYQDKIFKVHKDPEAEKK